MNPVITSSADLGVAVREARHRRGLTQGQLADQAGVRREWLTRLERGAAGSDLNRLVRVLAQLKIGLALVSLPEFDEELSSLREPGGLFSED